MAARLERSEHPMGGTIAAVCGHAEARSENPDGWKPRASRGLADLHEKNATVLKLGVDRRRSPDLYSQHRRRRGAPLQRVARRSYIFDFDRSPNLWLNQRAVKIALKCGNT